MRGRELWVMTTLYMCRNCGLILNKELSSCPQCRRERSYNKLNATIEPMFSLDRNDIMEAIKKMDDSIKYKINNVPEEHIMMYTKSVLNIKSPQYIEDALKSLFDTIK